MRMYYGYYVTITRLLLLASPWLPCLSLFTPSSRMYLSSMLRGTPMRRRRSLQGPSVGSSCQHITRRSSLDHKALKIVNATLPGSHDNNVTMGVCWVAQSSSTLLILHAPSCRLSSSAAETAVEDHFVSSVLVTTLHLKCCWYFDNDYSSCQEFCHKINTLMISLWWCHH